MYRAYILTKTFFKKSSRNNTKPTVMSGKKCYLDENSQILVLKYYQEITKTQHSIVSTDNESSAHSLAAIT